MKKTIVSFIAGAVITLALFGGSRAPIVSPIVEAQSANPRGDLVTGFRQDVAAINAAFDSFINHRARYVEGNINFVTGDLSGSNITSPSTFVADDIDVAVSDLNNIIVDVKAGGTIAAGEWNNVQKIR